MPLSLTKSRKDNYSKDEISNPDLDKPIEDFP